MAYRELALGKDLIGVGPVGIGDIFCWAAAKFVLVVVGLFATTECSSQNGAHSFGSISGNGSR